WPAHIYSIDGRSRAHSPHHLHPPSLLTAALLPAASLPPVSPPTPPRTANPAFVHPRQIHALSPSLVARLPSTFTSRLTATSSPRSLILSNTSLRSTRNKFIARPTHHDLAVSLTRPRELLSNQVAYVCTPRITSSWILIQPPQVLVTSLANGRSRARTCLAVYYSSQRPPVRPFGLGLTAARFFVAQDSRHIQVMTHVPSRYSPNYATNSGRPPAALAQVERRRSSLLARGALVTDPPSMISQRSVLPARLCRIDIQCVRAPCIIAARCPLHDAPDPTPRLSVLQLRRATCQWDPLVQAQARAAQTR
ncbi:hypothetical protein HETIRDRAFT_107847, partial [Heterobasidion irregulare TC 32-1]